MCIPSYPQVLAYSFLEELAGEFTKKYDRYKVEQALRPYNLIEFGKLYLYILYTLTNCELYLYKIYSF